MRSLQSAPGFVRRPRQRGDAPSTWLGRFGASLTSSRARFIALVFLLALVALTGGSSRPDIEWLMVLRPLAVLLAAYALMIATAEQLRRARAPLLIVVALMLLSLLQLVPLPHAIWTDLPLRETAADASNLVGMGDSTRPFSLDPDRTWNTFFALFVPLAAIGLVAIQAPERRRHIVPLLMAVALLSAIVGFLQAVGGNGLHFYRVTHDNYPVGLFANKNHQSIMLLWLMLAGAWLATTADQHRHSARGAIGGALGLILVLFPLLVLTGSRAGLLLSLPVLLLSAWLLIRAPAMQNILKRSGKRAKVLIGAVLAVLLIPLLFVFGVLAASDRLTALSRLFEVEAADDLRFQYLPIFQQMTFDLLPFGSGFGAFEKAFNLYEPSEMLTSRYMNQAHNDLMQLAIEGGLPALAILVAASIWFVFAIWRSWRSSSPASRNFAVFFGGSIVLWLAASLVDYPLRTPIAATLVAALTVQFCFLSTEHGSGRAGWSRRRDAPARDDAGSA